MPRRSAPSSPPGGPARWESVPGTDAPRAAHPGPALVVLEGGPGRRTAPRRGDGPLPARPGLSPRAASLIGERLRACYDEVLSEPVPERFTRLLGRAEAGLVSPPDERA